MAEKKENCYCERDGRRVKARRRDLVTVEGVSREITENPWQLFVILLASVMSGISLAFVFHYITPIYSYVDEIMDNNFYIGVTLVIFIVIGGFFTAYMLARFASNRMK